MDIDRIHIMNIYIGQHMHVMPTPPVKLQFSTLASPKKYATAKFSGRVAGILSELYHMDVNSQ